MYSNKLYTPLRYPGGKARFAPFVTDLIRTNEMQGCEYLEPFAGGAGLALVLLFDQTVSAIHLNDLDPAIAVFWRAATQQTDALVKMVADEPVTMESWHRWRGVMLGHTPATELERGFATLFMNRTNRSGILMGGAIGGKAQAGAYKLDARYLRDELCTRLERIGRHSANIHVYEEDALALLRRCHVFLPIGSLVYLDPPYYVKGAGLYRNSYVHEDHKAIARFILSERFRRPWIVSYDNTKEIQAMYDSTRKCAYALNYTAQSRYMGAEVMFFSPRLRAPAGLLEQLAA